MEDKFHTLTLKQAIAVQIFYSSPDDENLTGKTINSKELFEPVGEVVSVIFCKTEVKEDKALGRLIAAKAYDKILQQYNNPEDRFKMQVIYKDAKDNLHEASLSNVIKLTMSPEELTDQIMRFILEKEEYRFLKD